MKKNVEIRTMVREKEVYLYEIADLLKVSEQTFIRRLRKEVDEKKKSEILAAIEIIAKQKQAESNE